MFLRFHRTMGGAAIRCDALTPETLSGDVAVPDNITLLPLPPKCPELNVMENVWQFMRNSWLSNRVFQITTTSSTTAATTGTASSTSPGASCPSGCANGYMGSDYRKSV